MERDPFEKQLLARRGALDREELPEGLWEKIERESFTISKEDKPSAFNFWKVAASILLVISVGLTIRLMTFKQTPTRLGDISPIYQEMENRYLTQIKELETHLDQPEQIKQELEWIFEELAVLDSVQQEYLQDLKDDMNRDKVIGVLIDHYEKKIKLLRKLELEIQRNKHENELSIS